MAEGLEEPAISGIPGWNYAFFAPLWMSCISPAWLWGGKSAMDSVENFSQKLPTRPEEEELKQIFDKAAGTVYARFAYHRQHRLARELFCFMIDGISSSEGFDALRLLKDDWTDFNEHLAILNDFKLILVFFITGACQ
ncbi:hypothetical protein N7478_003547 [Penicillium angulare]|uniref:uncharacterized protein n=1 Tax=Penicillium angulare TaxID=116970 RepID=UPI002541B0A8|nr:uncharacterized protein N7478_003547 [Penicillium angulare]KAJ5287861.1 hypothetical protein N7478_003547 [Penicillium angulare]